MAKEKVRLTVNGKSTAFEAEPGEMLVDVLRDRLGLMGTKAGCRAGECGTCSVIMNGVLVASCIVPIKKADRASITTIEGLEKAGELHAVQKAFIEKGAIQCGFCTPAMVLAGKVLLDNNPNPTKEQKPEGHIGHTLQVHRLPEDRRGDSLGIASPRTEVTYEPGKSRKERSEKSGRIFRHRQIDAEDGWPG